MAWANISPSTVASHKSSENTPSRQAISPPRAEAVNVMNNTEARQAISHLATGSMASHSLWDSLGIWARARPHIFTSIITAGFLALRV